MTEDQKIGKKIRLARKQAGLTQKQLGKKLKKTGAAIGYLESGQRRITPETLKKIAQITNKPLSYFYEDRKEEDYALSSRLIALENQFEVIRALIAKKSKADQLKSEVVSVVSHQLRTPLSAIKVFLEMLMEGDAGKVNKKQLELLTQAYQNNERMIALVNDLLNVSRIETGQVRIEPKTISLENVTQRVIQDFAGIIKQERIKIKFEFPKELSQITADPQLARLIIQNLISNAIKFSFLKKKEIIITLEKKKEEILFSIKDHGIGIPQKQQNKVFTKFFRADNAVKKQTEGTGLGLYIAKAITELCQGKIWFESKENKGSTFSFSLPLTTSK